ncbi:MAG: RNA polymerase sigma factor [Actinomycetota bacterium]
MEGRPLQEQTLVNRAKEGDPKAYEELVRVHQGVALRVAYLVLRDAAEAEDATQEAFMKAFRALHRFRAGAEFRPWLLRIVRNEALNRRRSSIRRAALLLRAGADVVSGEAAPSPETASLERERRQRLLDAVEGLPTPLREVIECRFLLGLSEAESARVLRVPTGTVKSRSARALARLRALVGAADDI